MINIGSAFAKNVHALRKRLRLTQSEAAEASGISLRYFQQLEKGESWPSPETINSICKAFSCSPTDLFFAPDDESKLGLPGIDPEILDALRRADPLSIRLVRAALRLSDVAQQDVRAQKEQKLKTQR